MCEFCSHNLAERMYALKHYAGFNMRDTMTLLKLNSEKNDMEMSNAEILSNYCGMEKNKAQEFVVLTDQVLKKAANMEGERTASAIMRVIKSNTRAIKSNLEIDGDIFTSTLEK